MLLALSILKRTDASITTGDEVTLANAGVQHEHTSHDVIPVVSGLIDCPPLGLGDFGDFYYTGCMPERTPSGEMAKHYCRTDGNFF